MTEQNYINTRIVVRFKQSKQRFESNTLRLVYVVRRRERRFGHLSVAVTIFYTLSKKQKRTQTYFKCINQNKTYDNFFFNFQNLRPIKMCMIVTLLNTSRTRALYHKFVKIIGIFGCVAFQYERDTSLMMRFMFLHDRHYFNFVKLASVQKYDPGHMFTTWQCLCLQNYNHMVITRNIIPRTKH